MDWGMNWVDLLIIIIMAFFTLEALGKSLMAEILDFASFLLALILSFRYYNVLAKFFETQFNLPHGFSLVAGFMSAWFLTESIFFIMARVIFSQIPNFKIPKEKFLAVIPAFFRSLIFISLVLVLVGTFPVQPKIKKAVNESKIGSFLLSKAYQLEGPVKNVFGGVAQDSLTFLTIKPKTDERINLGFQTSQFTIDLASESEMVALVNKERVSRDLPSLQFDSSLREVGRFHSVDMLKKGYFSHYSPEGDTVADRAEKFGVKFLVIGENLAYAPSLELAHQGLMNSEGHRANILSLDFGKIGIGVMDGGVYGKMFTQVFTN